MNDIDLGRAIYERAIRCGFDDCGVIRADETLGAEFDGFLRKRMTDAPESAPFYRDRAGGADVKARFPWAKAVVILVFEYGRYRYPEEMRGRYAKAFFLDPLEEDASGPSRAGFEAALAELGVRAESGEGLLGGAGPLRLFAAKAGLGSIRKNNFLYTKNGSYNSLAGYVVDKGRELTKSVDLPPCGENCDLCQKACKTGAMLAPYAMNPFKCVSFLTTFGNCEVPPGITREMFGEWACGCDDCQDACPYNRGHDWTKGETLRNLHDLAPMIAPENLGDVSDEFLMERVVPRTSGHILPFQAAALRKNAARSAENHRAKR